MGLSAGYIQSGIITWELMFEHSFKELIDDTSWKTTCDLI
jgi:hypothetical protein